MNRPVGLAELGDLELVFKALSHEQRRQILQVLDARGGAMTSGEIADRFSCTWPTTTRHLRILEEAGLVSVERQGREWICALNRTRLARVAGRWVNLLTKVGGDGQMCRQPAARQYTGNTDAV